MDLTWILIVAAVFLGVLVAVPVVIVMLLAALGRRRSDDLARRVEDLEHRVRALEADLDSRTGGPRPGRSTDIRE